MAKKLDKAIIGEQITEMFSNSVIKEDHLEEQLQSPANLYLSKGFKVKEKERRSEQMHFYTTPSIAKAIREGAKANKVPLNEYLNQILENAIGGNL